MLAQVIKEKANGPGALCYGDCAISWADLSAQIEMYQAATNWLSNSRVGLAADSLISLLALISAMSESANEVVLLPANQRRLSHNNLDYLVTANNAGVEVEELKRDNDTLGGPRCSLGSLAVFSSGTTGTRHAHSWDWRTLESMLHTPNEAPSRTWLSAYAIDTFAGVQSFFHASVGAETLVLLRPEEPLWNALRWDSHFGLAMATPTYWRRSLLQWPAQKTLPTMGIISMGGEAASQDLLDRLRVAFPQSRVVHVYASSEHGSLFSVSDGRAGFPTELLGRQLASGVRLSLHGNELYVTRANGDAPSATGDTVRIEDGRILFQGRIGEQINVGGRKVSPLRIESVLLLIDGVAAAKVYGTRNPIGGQVVAADLVSVAGRDRKQVLRAVHTHCRESLEPHERPRSVRFIDEIPIAQSGKYGAGKP